MNISFHIGTADAIAATSPIAGGLYFIASGYASSGIWVHDGTSFSRYAFGPGSNVAIGNLTASSVNEYTATYVSASNYYTLTDQNGNSISALPLDREFVISFSTTNSSSSPRLFSTSGPIIRWDYIGVTTGYTVAASALKVGTFYKCARRYSSSYVAIYPYSGTTDTRKVSTSALYGALKADSANIVTALPSSPTANQIYFVT